MPPPPQDSDLPPSGEKAAAIRRMFGAIAPRYDLLNHVLSLNIDRLWRRRAVDRLFEGASGQGVYLDACAGTFDFALELAGRERFRGRVVGSDFALPMLQRGLGKLDRGVSEGGAPVLPACADALELPFPDRTFEGITVGFGVRNLTDLGAGFREFRRVLRPGGRLVVLELTTPRTQPLRALYLLYFLHILPRLGRLVSGHPDAYSYLPASVLEFPAPEALAEMLRTAGFAGVRWETYTGGMVAAHVADRPADPSGSGDGG